MIAFWISAALVAGVALAVLLRPVRGRAGAARAALNVSVYRDQLRELAADRAAGTVAAEDYERSKQEIERRLLEDVSGETPPSASGGRRAMLFAALAVPLLAFAVYWFVGTPSAVVPPEDQVNAMVERLAAKMRARPDDVEGWKLLGRSYGVLGRFKESVEAYGQALKRSPKDAQLLADFADALAMAQGQSLQGEPEQVVQRALEIDPSNLKALALAGTAAFGRKDYKAAAAYWERMLPLVPADSEDAKAIQSNVEEARSLAGLKPAPKVAAAAGKALKGTVKLSPALASRASPDDTVFIFARAERGPPMPLAVLRKQVKDLPASFALDDSMAMAPQLRLSSQPRVIVGARISKSGSATPQPGDLEGLSKPVANDAAGVAVTIDKVR
ncbi:MAG TPA: c-type cytochrome biogenesis protein CcmI [Burkholderiales bacterium]|nr:c-type cytochrome biogenesis protein CcmI [Burkholderiales bacterium]